MPLPTSREELKDYCLRKLGAPVLDINVDNHQLEDRIDEAISYFQDYHFDGVERIYLKRQITASVMTFDAPITGDFVSGELMTGQTSGATANFINQATDGLSLQFSTPADSPAEFQDGEIITAPSGATATLATASSIALGDIDNRWIPVAPAVLSLVEIFRLPTSFGGTGMFNVKYQFALNEMYNIQSMDLITYNMFQQHLAEIDELMNPHKIFRFNRKQDRIYLDINWALDITVGQYVVIECLRALDPEEYSECWADEFLRDYTTELFRLQWGTNMRKFVGQQLPGGVTLNGEEIYQEAKENLKELRERVRTEFEEPPSMQVG